MKIEMYTRERLRLYFGDKENITLEEFWHVSEGYLDYIDKKEDHLQAVLAYEESQSKSWKRSYEELSNKLDQEKEKIEKYKKKQKYKRYKMKYKHMMEVAGLKSELYEMLKQSGEKKPILYIREKKY